MSEHQRTTDDLDRRGWTRLGTEREDRRRREEARWAEIHASATRDISDDEHDTPPNLVCNLPTGPEVIATFDSDEEF